MRLASWHSLVVALGFGVSACASTPALDSIGRPGGVSVDELADDVETTTVISSLPRGTTSAIVGCTAVGGNTTVDHVDGGKTFVNAGPKYLAQWAERLCPPLVASLRTRLPFAWVPLEESRQWAPVREWETRHDFTLNERDFIGVADGYGYFGPPTGWGSPERDEMGDLARQQKVGFVVIVQVAIGLGSMDFGDSEKLDAAVKATGSLDGATPIFRNATIASIELGAWTSGAKGGLFQPSGPDVHVKLDEKFVMPKGDPANFDALVEAFVRGAVAGFEDLL